MIPHQLRSPLRRPLCASTTVTSRHGLYGAVIFLIINWQYIPGQHLQTQETAICHSMIVDAWICLTTCKDPPCNRAQQSLWYLIKKHYSSWARVLQAE